MTLTRRPAASLLATVGLLAVTAAWGSTFFMLKGIITRVPVADLLALRFLLAAAALTALVPTAVRKLNPAQLRAGVFLGLVYGAAQLVQTTGLATTAASVSGFLTGMYVVFTPLLGVLLLRTRISPVVWVATGLATAGLAVLSLHGLAISGGALLTLASAVLYALHIVGLGRWSQSSAALGLTVVQLWTVAAVCALGVLPSGLTLPERGSDWLALAYLAVVAGALALVVQTWAQAHLPAARAAVIMTMEPVFAAGFAVLFGGELLSLRMLLGGALVLAAMYLAEFGPRGRAPGGSQGRLVPDALEVWSDRALASDRPAGPAQRPGPATPAA